MGSYDFKSSFLNQFCISSACYLYLKHSPAWQRQYLGSLHSEACWGGWNVCEGVEGATDRWKRFLASVKARLALCYMCAGFHWGPISGHPSKYSGILDIPSCFLKIRVQTFDCTWSVYLENGYHSTVPTIAIGLERSRKQRTVTWWHTERNHSIPE